MADKILIADDDPETLRLISLMLQRQGYQIVSATNGSQALALARSEHPDLIVLDVMMPDMDGFTVARQLRGQETTAGIPILMFTAKSQVEDKISGYESGADDYLTKPVHPAELQARIRALLSRTKARTATPVERGRVVGVISAKGGVGASSLALNLALSYHKKTRQEVIAAELKPSQGSWGVEMGFEDPEGLTKLLNLKPNEITTAAIENNLITTTYGIRLLLASIKTKDAELAGMSGQLEAIVRHLALMAKVVFLDIGTPYLPGLESVLKQCDELFLVSDPQPLSIARARSLITDLNHLGFGKSRLMSVVIINRVRSDIALSAQQIQDGLGQPVSIVFPPAPEQAFQATQRGVPMVMIQQEGLVSQQFVRLAEQLVDRLNK